MSYPDEAWRLEKYQRAVPSKRVSTVRDLNKEIEGVKKSLAKEKKRQAKQREQVEELEETAKEIEETKEKVKEKVKKERYKKEVQRHREAEIEFTARQPEVYSRKPKKGSIAAEIQEKYFKTVNAPSEKLTKANVAALREAEKFKREGSDIKAGVAYSKAQTYRALRDFYGGATFAVNPAAWVGTARGVYQLATSPEARRKQVSDIQRDPLGAIISLPSAYLGGYATGKAASYAAQKLKITKPIAAKAEFKDIPLEQKIGESPASKLVKGKWPSQWELKPRRGSAVLIPKLKTKPLTTRVLVPKLIYPNIGATVGSISTLSVIKPIQVQDTVQRQRRRLLQTQKPVEVFEERQKTTQKAVAIPTFKQEQPQKTTPLVTPKQVPYQKQIPKQTPRQTSIQQDAQQVKVEPIQIPSITQKQDTKLRLDYSELLKQKKITVPALLKIGGETRTYGIRDPVEVLKELKL